VRGMKPSALGLGIFLAAAPVALFGQQGPATATPSSSSKATVSIGSGQSDANRPALQHRNPRYVVQRDDVLVLSFPLSPEFNQTVTIQPDGYITLLSAGDLHIQGMTVPEVVEALRKAYAKILHDPIITVDLKDFQKPFFVAGGQVGKPGQFDLRYDTTVSEGIAIAGGLTPAAKTQVFLYRRVSSDLVEVKALKLKDIMRGKNANEDVRLQPGDMIIIPESFISKFRKYVPYNVGLYNRSLP
jgi:polysaccharide export outer membrane protein